MKKIALVLLVIVFVSIAGTAMARGGRHGAWKMPGEQRGMREGYYGWQHDGERHGNRGGWGEGKFGYERRGGWHGMRGRWSDVPEEIRAKMTELDKLRIDMRAALYPGSVDRTKATEIFNKMTVLQQELRTWRFERRLDELEKWQKKTETNVPTSVDKTQ